MRRRLHRRDTRLALAVALSLALHGLLAALALLAPTPARVPPPGAAGTTIELELLPPAPPPVEAAAPPSPPAATQGGVARARPRRRPQPGPPAPGTPRARARGAAPEPVAGIPTPAGDPAEAGASAAAAWDDAEAPPGPQERPPSAAPYRALILSPRSPGGAGGPEHPAPSPQTEAGLEQQLAARIDGFVEGKQARDRAARPDGYWLDVRERLARRFSPDAELLRSAPGTGLLPGVDVAARGWLVEAERYGRTGAPWEEDPVTRQRPRDGQGVGDPPESVHGLWLHGMSATVVLQQDDEGRVLSVRLDRSSGNSVYDRQALAAVQALALERVELGRPQQGRRTVWSFESELVIVPPAPIVGCSFDATFVPVECYYPLKQLLHSRVRLLEVHAG